MQTQIERKLIELMASIFEIEESLISEDSNPENIEKWDSLAHMNLVVAIEQEFDIQFTEEQIVDSLSFEALVAILQHA